MLKLDDRMNDLAGRVIGAAIEVHRTLGPGYLESIYEEALCVELSLRGVSFVRQMPFEVRYKGLVVGSGRLDLMVEGVLVVELETVDPVLDIHRAQVFSCLGATGSSLGLVLNFKAATLKEVIERIIWTPLASSRSLSVPSVPPRFIQGVNTL